MRRTPLLVSLLVLAAGVGVFALSQSDRADEARTRRVTATATTASTLPTTSTSSTTTTTDVLGVDAVTTTTRAPVTTATTVVRAGCRNSNDPSCGPFYWDPQPVPDQPLVIDVRFTPERPRVGEDVTFEVLYGDPDAPELSCFVLAFGDGADPAPCDPPPRVCTRYGPWTPPAPRGLEDRRVEIHTYAQPGTYDVLVTATSRTPGVDPACTDSRTRRPGDPFGATAEVRLQIVVSP